MITVMGATGHTGSSVAHLLLRAGHRVRALGRSERRLAPLEYAGAEALTGSADDATFLTRAFTGADAVYPLLTSDVQSADYRAAQDRQGAAIATALAESGARYAVFLSSIGADLPAGTGPVAGLYAQEARLRTLDRTNVLILRPGPFFENFSEMLGVIKRHGISAGAVAPDIALPMIAIRDIAAVAAAALAARNWRGRLVRELHGACDPSFARVTAILGERIGKPDLPYVQLPYAGMAEALVQAGFFEHVAGIYVELDRAIKEGAVRPRECRTPENTTPTRFEDFVGELAQAYQAA